MRNWENLVKKYIRTCEVRGLAEATIKRKESLLLTLGVWLRMRRPVPTLEAVSREPEYLINFIKSQTVCKSKSHTYTVVSNLRCMGRFLLEEGEWKDNPLKWMRGPHIEPYGKLSRRRISRGSLEKIFASAAGHKRVYDRMLLVAGDIGKLVS